MQLPAPTSALFLRSISILCGACLLCIGCTVTTPSSGISPHTLAQPATGEQLDHWWTATQEALHAERLQIDRLDRRAGVITTLPEGSQHFFEFWRHDVATMGDFWEATANPMRRWVEIRYTPEEGESWREISVIVHKERLSSPDRQFNSTGAAYQYFGTTLPSTTGAARVSREQDRWVDMGRDPAMEQFLLDRILARAGAKTQ